MELQGKKTTYCTAQLTRGTVREVLEYRTLLWTLTLSELRNRYKGSVLGFLWTFMNPLLMLVVYSIVFSTIMRINIPHYPVFLFVGLLAWNMFASSVQSSAGVVLRQAGLVKKIYFPRHILPMAVVGGSLINLLLSYSILIPFMLINGFKPQIRWLEVPLFIAIEALMAAGISFIISGATVYLRDLEHIISIVIMAWFYVTPVLYSITMVHNPYSLLIKANPVSGCIIALQDILYFGTPLHWKVTLYSAIVAVMVFICGWGAFTRLSIRFAEEV